MSIIRATDRILMKMFTGNIIMKKSPMVVEIIGPAGSGKTTLLKTLRRSNKKIQSGVRLKKIKYIPLFIGHILLSLPTFLLQYQTGRWLTFREMKLMVYLKVFRHALERLVSNNSAITILDQGPVYKLARLHGFVLEGSKSLSFEKWRDSAINQWTSRLDLIVQLDAPDAVLVERINARKSHHRVRDQSEQSAHEFLNRYRTSFEYITSTLMNSSDLKVLCFDTSQEALDQIAVKVLDAIDTRNCK